MARLEIVMRYDEIRELIPYSLICTVRESSIWQTARRRRRWLAEFTEKEREAATRIFRSAHLWYLIKGVPEEVRMSTSTFNLWMKIADFCMSL